MPRQVRHPCHSEVAGIPAGTRTRQQNTRTLPVPVPAPNGYGYRPGPGTGRLKIPVPDPWHTLIASHATCICAHIAFTPWLPGCTMVFIPLSFTSNLGTSRITIAYDGFPQLPPWFGLSHIVKLYHTASLSMLKAGNFLPFGHSPFFAS